MATKETAAMVAMVSAETRRFCIQRGRKEASRVSSRVSSVGRGRYDDEAIEHDLPLAYFPDSFIPYFFSRSALSLT
jgi:hypothetical protein